MVAALSRSSVSETRQCIRNGYKRTFDLGVLFAAHLLLLPVWVALWIAIPLAIWLADRGPIFYIQERAGLNGRTFRAIKFRTMIPNAESATGPVWASANDPRTTKIGRILRRLHLDELPQVINVLKGEMSLVGPRPERPDLAEQFTQENPGFALRLRVRPGIAGLAQVRGTYFLKPHCKLRYDNLYIENMCVLMDAKLLLLSVWISLKALRRNDAG